MEYTKCRKERPRAARGSGACDTRAQDTARKAGMAWSSRRVLHLRNRCGATVQRGWRGPYRSLHSLQDDSELNTVTRSCSYEPNSTKALKSLVSYIATLQGDGMRAGGDCARRRRPFGGLRDLASHMHGGCKKRKPPTRFTSWGA